MRPAIVIAIVFSFFINVLALISPIYMLQVYDRVLGSRSELTLLFITLIAVGLYIVYAALEALRTQVLVRAGIGFDGQVRGQVFGSVLESTLAKKGAGAQAFRDIDTVREFMTGPGLLTFCDVPWVPVFVVASFMLHPLFGFMSIIGGVVILGLAIANDLFTRAPLQLATGAGIAAQNEAGTTMRNAEVMHAMGMWPGLQLRWERRRDDLIAWQASASDRGGGVMAAIKCVRQVLQTLILGGGAYLVLKGQSSSGSMIAASILVGRALAPIEQAVGVWKVFLNTRGSWDRLQSTFRSIDATPTRMSLPTAKGRVALDNVAVIPPGSDRPSLANVSFTLEPGTCLGVIGPSAGGKSSLVRAMTGVWPTAKGSVKVDGYDLAQWDPLQLGRSVGYLPQDVELFSGTVADNIARFGPFEAQEVIDAAMLAGVHVMNQTLTKGYDTQIGDGGTALSGGQRQRVGLARAVFRRPPMIYLDEPNASLDQAGEAALAQAIITLKQGSAIVFVTHKPNLLPLCDKILVLQNGLVTHYGDTSQVLAQLTVQPPPQQAPPEPANADT